jgi:hypothetical protein
MLPQVLLVLAAALLKSVCATLDRAAGTSLCSDPLLKGLPAAVPGSRVELSSEDPRFAGMMQREAWRGIERRLLPQVGPALPAFLCGPVLLSVLTSLAKKR